MTDELRREHRRLRQAFTALLFALAPVAGVEACGQASPPSATGGDDAGAGDTPDHAVDAPPEASADAPSDAAPADAGQDCGTVVMGVDAGADVDPSCTYTLPCGLPSYLSAVGCDLYGPDDAALGCSLMQGEGCMADAFAPGPAGEVKVFCTDCLGGSGRRPRGLAKARDLGAPTAVGAYFARMAHDEAAAVRAFRQLGDELVLHGAPAALIDAAERSARDEERHARVMARRARLSRAKVPALRQKRSGPRTLLAVALENAVEGCVHETFGALLLGWQAARAPDASLRQMFARIAADETRHAALSWAVARWIEGRLDPGGRARVAAARRRAIHSLLRRAPPAPFDGDVGRPTPAERAALVHGMIEHLGLA